jgi:hypothetical protein
MSGTIDLNHDRPTPGCQKDKIAPLVGFGSEVR